MASTAEYGSPEWWRDRLLAQLRRRSPDLTKLNNYYNGKHKLQFAGKKFREVFGNLFNRFADNWCEVVVDAVEERLNIEGFRFGDNPEADKDTWAIWQANELDADSQLVHTDALATGFGYTLVWADADGAPVITVESPLEVIVAHEPGSRRLRRAAVKHFVDEEGYYYAFLYLPTTIYKWRSTQKRTSEIENSSSGELNVQWKEWQPDSDDEWPLPNPLELVPIVPFYNKPRTIRAAKGVSEIEKVVPIQDAVNKLCSDLLIASEFGSFRQRWASGLELDEDEEGNKINPFKNGPGNLWAAEGGDGDNGGEVKFGEFGETNLGNIVKAVEMFVQHLASQSRTPPHYLNAQADRLSGESIKAAETGLVSKTLRRARHYGESHEKVMRLAFLVLGDPRAKATSAETVWADPESRTEAEHVDATLKKKALNVPTQQLWEDLGYSPQQITRFEAMRAQEALLGLLAPTAPLALPPAPPEPPVS